MSVFKAYDIRGVVGSELTDELVEKIGYAISKFFNGSDVIVGMDVRTHSFKIAEALSRGLLAGGHVIFIGTSTTPIAHFASQTLQKPAVMITASHNPPEYNGMKIMKSGGLDLESHEIQQLASMLETPPITKRGVVYVNDVLSKYFDYMFNRFGKLDFSIGFDPANAAGVVLKPLLDRVFKKVVAINDYPDGRFPAHLPDPEKAENLRQLRSLVVENKLDVGIALDGDCDRVGIVTSSGEIFRPEKVVYALLNYYARPGDVVVLDVTMPLYLEKIAEERGVKIIRQRVGHSFQKPTAVKHNALFWAEYSGHIGFREHNYFDDGIYAALKLLSILSEVGITLDEVLKNAPKVYEERIDIRFPDPKKAMGDIKRKISGMEFYEIDGVDIRTKEGRILIRPSNTEPLIRVKIESETKEGFEKLKALLSQLVSL
ncbi:phosphomannomutase (pmm) [Pyrobaculum aerophilum str. IM2]|uniref:Phosphomannomutase (Pmm) n=2 Tax=Pyrobaculum aerophilum TaxID=13773 RepID=Q8ZYI0_PYRAE|nr:phosphomannomutase/phosphoglucomutase [Pyrobaculum aerophilum]AAL63013.1 phosphomannomutase (pmm) [Pyrobaculum aerophilum str. IM2]HII48216.1 phosphomannomutase/phosphoglucomutase [Pyrobaculum aerophilum]